MQYKLLLAVLAFGTMNAMETDMDIETPSAPNLLLHRDDHGFYIEKNQYPYAIEEYNIDPTIKNMSNEQIKAFLESGCSIIIQEINEDEYALKAHIPGFGGGPITGWLAYCATKTLCYGTAVGALGVVTVASGGVAGAAVGGTLAASTLGASGGAAIVGGAISMGGAAGTAALATGGAACGVVGGVTGAIAAVEGGSMAVGAFFTALPFLP